MVAVATHEDNLAQTIRSLSRETYCLLQVIALIYFSFLETLFENCKQKYVYTKSLEVEVEAVIISQTRPPKFPMVCLLVFCQLCLI